jgi:diketogulonate reductase-like aldo/keto reductase
MVARRWGQQGTTRSQNNPTVDMFGRPLFHDSEKAIVDAVQQIAPKPAGCRQVGLAWVLKNPVVTAPIVGATKPHHLADAVAARPQAHGKRNRRTREPLHPAHPDVFLTSQRRQCSGLPSPRDLEGVRQCPA